jgi:ABC-2 type transport system ATP-binding protein
LTAAPAVEALGLAKRFGRTVALRDFTLTIGRGEVVGLLGANGAGKTTSVKLLLGLARPTSGAANLLGLPLGSREARRRIGYLPELFRYPDWLTALEVIDVHARLLGVPAAQRRAQARDVLDRVGLGARAGDRVGSFSKGMQQRLGLGVALTGAPELVVLDEPTSALDPIGRHDVRAIIEDLRGRGTAVLLNSHLLTEVERVCDHIAVVDRGTIVARGTIDAMLGAGTSLRLRLGNAGQAVDTALARYGALTREPPWIAVAGVRDADVPRVVAELVALGADVFGVEIVRSTLEERFIELLGPPDAAVDDRIADPA